MIDEATLEAARALRQRRMGWRRLAKSLGVGEDALRRALDEEYRRHRNARTDSRRRAYLGQRTVFNAVRPDRPDAELIARLRSQIPDDTRDLTARFFGDPLPGLSALDRKLNAEQAESRP